MNKCEQTIKKIIACGVVVVFCGLVAKNARATEEDWEQSIYNQAEEAKQQPDKFWKQYEQAQKAVFCNRANFDPQKQQQIKEISAYFKNIMCFDIEKMRSVVDESINACILGHKEFAAQNIVAYDLVSKAHNGESIEILKAVANKSVDAAALQKLPIEIKIFLINGAIFKTSINSVVERNMLPTGSEQTLYDEMFDYIGEDTDRAIICFLGDEDIDAFTNNIFANYRGTFLNQLQPFLEGFFASMHKCKMSGSLPFEFFQDAFPAKEYCISSKGASFSSFLAQMQEEMKAKYANESPVLTATTKLTTLFQDMLFGTDNLFQDQVAKMFIKIWIKKEYMKLNHNTQGLELKDMFEEIKAQESGYAAAMKHECQAILAKSCAEYSRQVKSGKKIFMLSEIPLLHAAYQYGLAGWAGKFSYYGVIADGNILVCLNSNREAQTIKAKEKEESYEYKDFADYITSKIEDVVSGGI